MTEYPWPGFLDYDFYSIVSNGKVTDVDPGPDFLVADSFDDKDTCKTWLKEKLTPLEGTENTSPAGTPSRTTRPADGCTLNALGLHSPPSKEPM